MKRTRLLFFASLSATVSLLVASAHGQQNPPPAQQQEQGQPQEQAPKMDVARLFATTCGWCHEGGGRKQGRGPKLAGTDKSDQFMITRIKAGKSPGMPAFGRSFNDEQIQAIVAYIRSLPDP
ncbi:MAG TPA: cytochrome c [Vineibacter sp.]|nr:cytochrome c [Vineibacter sp.]